MTRDRLLKIVEENSNCVFTSRLADAIMEELSHEGKIKIRIADGWVDPSSNTMVWHVAIDLSRMDELPASNRTFASPLRYFLSREKAEAFLKSERERTHWNQVQIGNGKWIDKDSTEYWHVDMYGKINPPDYSTISTFKNILPDCFATLAEAEAKSAEIHKGLGHIRIGDGSWVGGEDIGLWNSYGNGIQYTETPARCFMPHRLFKTATDALVFLGKEMGKDIK